VGALQNAVASGGNGSGGAGDGQSQPPPRKKQKRDKRDKMFVFLDHINNTRVSSDNSDGEDESDGTKEQEGEDELKIVAGSSDEEEEAATEAPPVTAKEEEDDVAETSESETDDGEDGMGEEDGDGSDSSTTIASAGEPQHDQVIKWVSSEQPASGRGINQRLMPEKITKLEHLTVFWKRIKQSIKCDTVCIPSSVLCVCARV
jgi:hypothetical protein